MYRKFLWMDDIQNCAGTDESLPSHPGTSMSHTGRVCELFTRLHKSISVVYRYAHVPMCLSIFLLVLGKKKL